VAFHRLLSEWVAHAGKKLKCPTSRWHTYQARSQGHPGDAIGHDGQSLGYVPAGDSLHARARPKVARPERGDVQRKNLNRFYKQ
jgi:hypothetical protein